MSLRLRVLLLACISLAALLAIGWVEHSIMQRLHRQTLDATLRTSRSEVTALYAQVTFKKQVQEWKNVLIRGHKSEDRDKYWNSFLFEEKRTRELVGELLAGLPARSPARGIATNFLESHQELGQRYISALAVFDRGGEMAYRDSDVLVRGRDRTPTDLFDQIIQQVASERVSEQKHLKSALHQKVILFVSLGLAAVGLLFVILLMALSRWVAQPVSAAIVQADRIAAGDLDVRMKETSITELGNLQRALNHMAEQLKASYAKLESSNADLALARDAALETSRLKSQFLANMSHEIRTPLNGVIGMNELLLGTRLDSEQRDMAKMAHASGEALLGLVDDVLDFSKIEANEIHLRDEPFHLPSLTEEIALITGARAYAKDVALGFLIHPATPTHLRGDPDRTRQVLINLLTTAVKFTDRGEIVCRIQPIEMPGDHVWLRFEVTDSGIGIPQDQQQKIFESFRQVDNSNTRTHGGSGLGLAICKRLVEHMGGEIGVHSQPGSGSRFWFTLPFDPVPEEIPAPPADLPLPPGLRVMVVDDHAINREVISRLLTRWQAQVETFVSAPQALARLATPGPAFHLILTDFQMPGMHGVDFARQIVALPGLAQMKIVLLSPVGGVATSRGPDRDLFAAVATKPIMQRALRSLLTSVLTPGNPPGIPTPPVPAAPVSAARILVAEDNPINAKLMTALLQRAGYTCDLAADGEQALRLLHLHPYDVILMDCQMPVMDGFQATRRIREIFAPQRGPVIIALTANAVAGDRERCLEAGMDDYLSKPVRPATLQEMLHRYTEPALATAGR